MALLEFSITPIGVGESVSRYVATAIDIVDHSGLDYRTSAMGTIVEGELDEVFDVLKKCVTALAGECNRVSVSAKLDYRQGAKNQLGAKVAHVEQALGRAI